jgi:single-strand DNA-binding protein
MEHINLVVITGNLTKDPEVRTTKGGTTVVTLRVAVNGRQKQGDKWVDRPDYFNVTVWGKQGENCAEYLSKGRPVAVQGRLRFDEWESDGRKRYDVSITATSVQFLPSKDDSSSRRGDPGEYKEEQPDVSPGSSYEDDIPF